MTLSGTAKLHMKDWADGMFGFMPVFDSREAAEKWGPGRRIIELEVGEDK